MNKNKVTHVSALWYTGISLALAVMFILATGGGPYNAVSRYGGAIWIFILAMIITMPVIIPWFKKK
ncbi:MAG: hypothetical protein M0T74_10215 [Desulfitobacterium hafniense]|nr:hypothetical protein [Desulfitobacterium hafniense]